MAYPFDSYTVLVDKEKEATISYKLGSFNPKKHTSKARVDAGPPRKLIVEATVDGGKVHKHMVKDVDIAEGVKVENHKGMIDVHMNKNSNFSLNSKLD